MQCPGWRGMLGQMVAVSGLELVAGATHVATILVLKLQRAGQWPGPGNEEVELPCCRRKEQSTDCNLISQIVMSLIKY